MFPVYPEDQIHWRTSSGVFHLHIVDTSLSSFELHMNRGPQAADSDLWKQCVDWEASYVHVRETHPAKDSYNWTSAVK